MEFVSFPQNSFATRWRPDPAIGHSLRGWQPYPGAVAPRMHRMAVAPRRLGQETPPIADVGLSIAASLGAAVTGFGLAFLGGQYTTWRWIGGLIGTVGVMRILHDVSKAA